MNRILRSFVTVSVIAAGIVGANAIISASTNGEVSLSKLISKKVAKAAAKPVIAEPVSPLQSLKDSEDHTLRLVVGATGNVSYTPATAEASSENEDYLTVGKTGNYCALAAGTSAIKINGVEYYNVLIKPAAETVDATVADELETTSDMWTELNKNMATLTANDLKEVTDRVAKYSAGDYGFGDLDDATVKEINDYLEYVAYVTVPRYHSWIKTVNYLASYYSTGDDDHIDGTMSSDDQTRLMDALQEIQDSINKCQEVTNEHVAEIVDKYYDAQARKAIAVKISDLRKSYNANAYGAEYATTAEKLGDAQKAPVSLENDAWQDPATIDLVKAVYNAPVEVVAADASYDEVSFEQVVRDWTIIDEEEALIAKNNYAHQNYLGYLDWINTTQGLIDAYVADTQKETKHYLNDKNAEWVASEVENSTTLLDAFKAAYDECANNVQAHYQQSITSFENLIKAVENGNNSAKNSIEELNPSGVHEGKTVAQGYVEDLKKINDDIAAAQKEMADLQKKYDDNVDAYSTLNDALADLKADWQRKYDIINNELIEKGGNAPEALKKLNAELKAIDAIGDKIEKDVKEEADGHMYLGDLLNTKAEIQKSIDDETKAILDIYKSALDNDYAKVEDINAAAFEVVKNALTTINANYKARAKAIASLKKHPELVNDYTNQLFVVYNDILATYQEAYNRYQKVEVANANAFVAAVENSVVDRYYYDNKWVEDEKWVETANKQIDAIYKSFFTEALAEDKDAKDGTIETKLAELTSKYNTVKATCEALKDKGMYDEEEGSVYYVKYTQPTVEALKAVNEQIDAWAKKAQDIYNVLYADMYAHANDADHCELYWWDSVEADVAAELASLDDIQTKAKEANAKYLNDKAYDRMIEANQLLFSKIDPAGEGAPEAATDKAAAKYKEAVQDIVDELNDDKAEIEKQHNAGTAVEFENSAEYTADILVDALAIAEFQNKVKDNERLYSDVKEIVAVVWSTYAALNANASNTKLIDPVVKAEFQADLDSYKTTCTSLKNGYEADYLDLWKLIDSADGYIRDAANVITDMQATAKAIEKRQAEYEAEVAGKVQKSLKELENKWVDFYTTVDATTPMKHNGEITSASELYNTISGLETETYDGYSVNDADPENVDENEANHTIWQWSSAILAMYESYSKDIENYETTAQYDADGDASVTMSDAIVVLDLIGGDNMEGDVNGDGEVDLADVIAILDNIEE